MKINSFLGLWIAILLAITSTLSAQDDAFQLNGNAIPLGDNCYRLTTEISSQAGSMWALEQVNLENDFVLDFDINLGSIDDFGADGIYFVLQPISTSLGSIGGGIGFAGITPAIGIEFDTWQNNNYNDPVPDHIAIMQNGDLDHFGINNLAGPEPIFASSANAEDGNYHHVRFTWDATDQMLSAYVECELRVSYQGDIVNDIFSGDPNVFWGFTSATGFYFNNHEVCLNYSTFLDEILDYQICEGTSVPLTAPEGFTSYEWSPADGLDNTTSNAVVATPTESMAYYLTVVDACGFELYDTINFIVDVIPILDLGADFSVCPNTPITLDVSTIFGFNYTWSDGSTDPIFNTTVTATDTFWVNINTPCAIVTDSIIVSISDATTSSQTFAVCPGETYEIDGMTLPVDTTAVFEYVAANGCDSLVTVSINAYEVINNSETITICPGETYEIDGITLPIDTTAVFEYVATNGCDSLVTVSINAHDVISTIDAETLASCPVNPTGSINNVLVDGGLAPYSYSIDNSTYTTDTERFINLAAGAYTLYVQDANNCISNQTFVIDAKESLSLSADNAILGCEEASVNIAVNVLTGNDGNITYAWADGSTLNTFTAIEATSYTVTVSNNCESVTQSITVQPGGGNLELPYQTPTAISPNEDGFNDAFCQHPQPDMQINRYEMQIYNRWGNQVFTSTDVAQCWDGQHKGTPVEIGTYVWWAKSEVVFCGETYELMEKGNFVVIQ